MLADSAPAGASEIAETAVDISATLQSVPTPALYAGFLAFQLGAAAGTVRPFPPLSLLLEWRERCAERLIL